MNSLSTDELLKRLEKATSLSGLEHFERDTANQCTRLSFPEYIETRRKEAGVSPARLIEAAQIQRNYGYQILNGVKKPGRNKILSLCISLKLSYRETQQALTIAGEGILYPKNPRDAVLIFCINQKLTVMETNELLDARGEALL